jgi:hypothetical protein
VEPARRRFLAMPEDIHGPQQGDLRCRALCHLDETLGGKAYHLSQYSYIWQLTGPVYTYVEKGNRQITDISQKRNRKKGGGYDKPNPTATNDQNSM